MQMITKKNLVDKRNPIHNLEENLKKELKVLKDNHMILMML